MRPQTRIRKMRPARDRERDREIRQTYYDADIRRARIIRADATDRVAGQDGE